MCLSRFVAFRVTFNKLCGGLLPFMHLKGTDQSWHIGPKDLFLTLRSCFWSLLTLKSEFSADRLPASIKFAQFTQEFVISLYIKDNETNFPKAKQTLRVFT